jgi:uncharacterized protein
MIRYLLDVNVLLALAWPSHEFHEAAHNWWTRSKNRWATCALTELSFIRLSSNPAYTADAVTPFEAATLLEKLVAVGQHEYWRELPRLKGEDFQKLSGHKQVADFFLSELAGMHSAKLATFDSGMRSIGASERYELIPH